MTEIALAQTAPKETSHALIILAAVLAVLVVAAAVYVFGYPLLILLADGAALLGVAMMFFLTLVDVLKGGKRKAS